MNSLNSLYFPGTTLCSISQYPLFLLFSRIHLLKVAENNIHGSDVKTTDSFIKSGFYQEHTPSPLGDDLERFSRLINDIKNRKDDYGSQLGALTLAAMSNHSPESGDSRQEIISSLLRNDPVFSNKHKEKADLKLWQARLVLAIGEILDHEEEDIARQLAVLKNEETQLYKELQGESDNFEEENPFGILSQLRNNMNPPGPGNMGKRFFSWQQLYKESDMPTCDLLLTTSKDCADQVLESFDTKHNEVAIYSGQLSLPAIINWHENDAVQQIRSYQEKNKQIIEGITKELLSLKTCINPLKNKTTESILSNLSKPWEKSLESHFPAKKFGRIPLSIYCFADTPCSTLLGIHKQNSVRTNGLMVLADISSTKI